MKTNKTGQIIQSFCVALRYVLLNGIPNIVKSLFIVELRLALKLDWFVVAAGKMTFHFKLATFCN